MIGMMYLMLTAMLALNVSGDLLNAYLLVDSSILQAKSAIESKNVIMYNQFGNAYESNKTKVEKSWEQAQEIKKKADELVEHIQELKVKFVNTADGEGKGSTPEPYQYQSKSNTNVAAQLMLTEGNGKRSDELKKMLTEYKEMLLGFVDTKDSTLRNSIVKGLSVDPSGNIPNNPDASWEAEKFEYIPLAATMALMSQMQTTTRNLESDVVRYLYTKLDEESFKFNKVDAKVIPRSNYVLVGEEYFAEIMIAARDTTQLPSIDIPGRNVQVNDQGVGILRIPTSSPGTFPWSGTISIKNPDGTDREFKVKDEFIVATPNVVVSAVKMNVLYEGIENPLEISVPGVPSENLTVRLSSNATSVKRGNQYMVTPRAGTAGGRVEISVSARMNNQDRGMGKPTQYRIKRVPNPFAVVNGMQGGKIRKEILVAQSGVLATMGEDFDFDLKWDVTSFRVSAIRGGYEVDEVANNALMTKAQKDLISGIGRGGKVVFDNIRAAGPGGTRRDLAPIVFVID